MKVKATILASHRCMCVCVCGGGGQESKNICTISELKF